MVEHLDLQATPQLLDYGALKRAVFDKDKLNLLRQRAIGWLNQIVEKDRSAT